MEERGTQTVTSQAPLRLDYARPIPVLEGRKQSAGGVVSCVMLALAAPCVLFPVVACAGIYFSVVGALVAIGGITEEKLRRQGLAVTGLVSHICVLVVLIYRGLAYLARGF